MELNSNEQNKDLIISFKYLNEDEQYKIYDSLIGKKLVINGSCNNEKIVLEGILESKGLYLGGVSYDLKLEGGLKPIGFNLLYDVEEIKVIH
ncbi:hypothetical protein E3U55_13570 [Filobacillus milosensis]|uniref:Uncharacterized protein n=1 Tax=Filobacillus milosensis TaxID=94137 RepID=A0A4Y8IL88_9BACI|nr:hypothetical protein [Filobacillus milosensis]TFB14649.1 hypothetical protein E3U55_13570 [Filobacillus milosensis]